MIHRVLNIFEPTKFATHMSYFFFMIAVIVVANSGSEVQAAMIVAQIAHCDIHKFCAINIAESTMTSEAIMSKPILAISFVIFKSICLEVSLIQGILFLKVIIINNINRIAMNISLVLSIQNCIWKFQDLLFISMNASSATHINRYMKFFTLGTETSMASSVGDSFL